MVLYQWSDCIDCKILHDELSLKSSIYGNITNVLYTIVDNKNLCTKLNVEPKKITNSTHICNEVAHFVNIEKYVK